VVDDPLARHSIGGLRLACWEVINGASLLDQGLEPAPEPALAEVGPVASQRSTLNGTGTLGAGSAKKHVGAFPDA